jgi:hypothetical protein
MRRHSPLLTLSLVPAGLGLLLLLGLSLLHLRTPDPRDGTKPATPTASESHPAAEHTRQFFGWPSRVQWQPLTNTGNPFFTLAIQPPPPPTPPPPPPATRKIDVTYRGFLETSAGIRRAVVQVADKQIVAKRGETIVADFTALDIELRFLTVTNSTGKSLKFPFATNQPVEVPAK